MITITTSTKLSVKELARPLGVSVWYLYKARSAGLPMDWDEESRCYVSTPEEVKRWIKSKKFKIVKGRAQHG